MQEASDAMSFLRNVLSQSGAVEDVVTHASHLLIGRDRVFKLKRPVCYAYLDYSSARLRLNACQQEFRLNAKTAPSLYLGAHAVTLSDRGYAIDGQGELVDAFVEMRRFPQECLLDEVAARGALTRPLLSALADSIARLHAEAAEIIETDTRRIERVLDINEAAFRSTGLSDDGPGQALPALARAAYARVAERLHSRASRGKVRRCHGDLILRNIALLDGVPTPFDCLEFSEDLATTDILYDLAFLMMDLWHKGLRPEANWLLNRYLDRLDEEADLSILPLFMGMRAMVRAHVAAALARGDNDDAHAMAEARAYVATAADILTPRASRLLAVGGFSGSGKSTLAARLACEVGAAPGARVLSSDRIRKALHGIAPEEKLPPEAYRPEVSLRVYGQLLERSAGILTGGGSVIADAVFDRQEDRAAIEAIAQERGTGFTGIWLDAPAHVQARRITERQGDASDAMVMVLDAQRARGHGDLGWARLDGSQGLEVLVEAVRCVTAL